MNKKISNNPDWVFYCPVCGTNVHINDLNYENGSYKCNCGAFIDEETSEKLMDIKMQTFNGEKIYDSYR